MEETEVSCAFCGASWWHLTGTPPQRLGCGIVRPGCNYRIAGDSSSWTLDQSLWNAVACNDDDAAIKVQALLDAGANPNYHYGRRTVMENSLGWDHVIDIMHRLVAAGGRPSSPNGTPLHCRSIETIAAAFWRPDLLRILLQAPTLAWTINQPTTTTTTPPIAAEDKETWANKPAAILPSVAMAELAQCARLYQRQQHDDGNDDRTITAARHDDDSVPYDCNALQYASYPACVQAGIPQQPSTVCVSCINRYNLSIGMGRICGPSGDRGWRPNITRDLLEVCATTNGAEYLLPFMIWRFGVDLDRETILPRPIHSLASPDVINDCPWPINTIMEQRDPEGYNAEALCDDTGKPIHRPLTVSSTCSFIPCRIIDMARSIHDEHKVCVKITNLGFGNVFDEWIDIDSPRLRMCDDATLARHSAVKPVKLVGESIMTFLRREQPQGQSPLPSPSVT